MVVAVLEVIYVMEQLKQLVTVLFVALMELVNLLYQHVKIKALIVVILASQVHSLNMILIVFRKFVARFAGNNAYLMTIMPVTMAMFIGMTVATT